MILTSIRLLSALASQEKFLALRIKKEEETRKANKMDPREFPDYYVSASGSASDRTIIRLIDQFKARFIVHQLMQGVPFKDIKTTVEMKDLNLFFEGLGYWAPQKIVSHFNADGTLEFKNESQVIEKLLGSGVLDSRVRFHLEMMIDEARDFVQVANSVTQDFMVEYKSEITKYPELFPSTIGSKVPADTQKAIAESIENLSRLKLRLEVAKAEGASSLELTALRENYTKKEAELIKYLDDNRIMTRDQLKAKMKEVIVSLQGERTQKGKEEESKREEQRKVVKEALEPINIAKKMIFHSIAPGKFRMGVGIKSRIETEITKPFEMMATQVTQMMWARLKIAMGEEDLNKINPSHFKTGTDYVRVNIEGIDVSMKPDHPVESVSWNDVMEYIDGLNRLSSSDDAKTQELLGKLIPGHRKGDIYDLPTEAQWEFVMRNRGKADGEYFDKNDSSDLAEHAWSGDNSKTNEYPRGSTHAVATKKPRMIDRGDGIEVPFYDLEGNVWEWNKDVWDSLSPLPGGKDPVGSSGSSRIILGGGWYYEVRFLRTGYRNSIDPGSSNEHVGFRLVRTRP